MKRHNKQKPQQEQSDTPNPHDEEIPPAEGSADEDVDSVRTPEEPLRVQPGLIGKFGTLIWWANPFLTLLLLVGIGFILWKLPQATALPTVSVKSPDSTDNEEVGSPDNRKPLVAPRPKSNTDPTDSNPVKPEPVNTEQQPTKTSEEYKALEERAEKYRNLLNDVPDPTELQGLIKWVKHVKAEQDALKQSLTQYVGERKELDTKLAALRKNQKDYEDLVKQREQRSTWLKGIEGKSPLLRDILIHASKALQGDFDRFKMNQKTVLEEMNEHLKVIARGSFETDARPEEDDARSEIVTIVLPHIAGHVIENKVLEVVKGMESEFQHCEQITGAVEIRVVGIENSKATPIRFSGKAPEKLMRSFGGQVDRGLDFEWYKNKLITPKGGGKGRLVLIVPLYPGTLNVGEDIVKLPNKRRTDVLLISPNSPESLFEPQDNNKKNTNALALQKWQHATALEGSRLNLICLKDPKPPLPDHLKPENQIRNFIRRVVIPETLVFKNVFKKPEKN